ncbi:MAG: ABC transporter ATP-binding protein [Desulfobacteraceae bacterium]|nr:MAG: ABC transporter ATP-binding protein [Desulfobacteraceae bacterium]
MIHLEDIYKSFDGTDVLKGISLDVDKGEILALIGRSGFGKSVLLKHVAGLMRPDRGRILVDGQDICTLRGKALFELRARLGFLFQSGALFDSMTIFDNVAFPLREKSRMKEEELRKKVQSALEQVGLTDSEEKFPSQISGGMVKRASLARALVEEPEIMLFDEPTTGLDPITGRNILNLIQSCHQRFKFTGVIVTHEIPKVFEIVDKVAMLHDGKVAFFGKPEDILTSTDPTVRSFVCMEEDDLNAIECHREMVGRLRRKREIHLT